MVAHRKYVPFFEDPVKLNLCMYSISAASSLETQMLNVKLKVRRDHPSCLKRSARSISTAFII